MEESVSVISIQLFLYSQVSVLINSLVVLLVVILFVVCRR